MIPRTPSRILGGLTALVLLIAMNSPFLAAQASDSDSISKLLTEAKSHAALAEDDAAALDSFTNSKLSWQSHTAKLEQMKEHVNALGKVSKQLGELNEQGSSWQQKAIKQIDPLLRDMASQLTDTINHLNDNQANIHMQQYRDYTRANYDLANRTADVIRDYVEYDKAKSKAEALEQKLELPSSSNGD
jgi:hypothetical protein